MEEQVVVENEGLSFSDIWKVIKKYWIGLVSIIAGCLIIGVLAAYFVVPKKYEASQNLFYDNGTVADQDNMSVDLNTNANVIKYVFSRLNDRTVYEETAKVLSQDTEHFKVPVDYKNLMKELTMSRPDDLTIRFSYTAKEKELIPIVLNTFTNQALSFIDTKLGYQFEITHDIREDDIVDSSTSKFLVVGASGVVGLIIGLCYEFIANASDKTIRNKNYMEATYGIKVIGLIPDLERLTRTESEE